MLVARLAGRDYIGTMILVRGCLTAVVLLLVGAASAAAESQTFGVNSPAAPFHRWVVPATVCSTTFDLNGAEGSTGSGGAQVISTLKVTPGTAYDIYVGDFGTIGNGGYNGGGAAAYGGVGGGGATDVRDGPGLGSRILVAAGGGGNGANPTPDGGHGGIGALVGQDGTTGISNMPGKGGKGATATSGGAGGGGFAGKPGQLGVGGAGGSGNEAGGGGGGGGGLFGGGGGGGANGSQGGGGGGGGSSLTAGGTVSDTPHPGRGKATVTFNTGSCVQPDGGLQQLGGAGGGGAGPDTTKPTIGAVRFSTSVFRAAASGPAFGAQRRPIGTKVTFNLSETSAVRLTVQRKTSGRRVSGKCKTRTRKNRKKPKCTLWKNVTGSFTVPGKAGTNTFKFRGRIGGKKLRPGSYRLNGTATDPAKNKSVPKRKGFKIVR